MLQQSDRKQRPAQRLYDLKAAALYLGRPVSGVRGLIWSGQLPVIRSGRGGKQFVDVLDMDAYIEQNKACELAGVGRL